MALYWCPPLIDFEDLIFYHAFTNVIWSQKYWWGVDTLEHFSKLRPCNTLVYFFLILCLHIFSSIALVEPFRA